MDLPTGAAAEKSTWERENSFTTYTTSHNGIALPSSFINRSPWVDYIHFHTEEAEIYYMDINPEEA